MSGKERKKRAAALGMRIGCGILAAFTVLVFAAYYVLSDNFQNMLTDYTINLMQSMVEMGVAAVEDDLQTGREETAVLAGNFAVPADGQPVDFPAGFAQSKILRMVYVSDTGSVASDGRQLDVRGRPDIDRAFQGESAIYGPYFNEENEYVICYSSPVIQNGRVSGVLCIEKDGYRLCELIGSIKFVHSGESYIIDEGGTDIAVSNQEHIDWVQSRYNAQRILREREDPVTRSVMELEQKGLRGETGVGTYQWEGSVCYVAYAPIPSTGWVLLTGLREEELTAMTQSALLRSMTNGPVLLIYAGVILLLIVFIIFWIVSSMKKSDKIHEQLRRTANYDSLTGTKNRNSYHAAIDLSSGRVYQSFACIYIDANGLHEINNHLGHQAGDEMLKAVGKTLQHTFSEEDVYRIGGDEFVVFCKNQEKKEILHKTELSRKKLREHGYEISAGIEWREQDIDIKTMVNIAEDAMQRDKQQYYRKNGKERQIRVLNHKLEQMMLAKQDADAFLSVLAPEFNGVYFVDLGSDAVRHLYIPPYFEEMLREAGDVFSKAMELYMERAVMPEYRQEFKNFCDYDTLEAQLNENTTLGFVYQKIDGAWVELRVLKFKTYTPQNRETLWIFFNRDNR